MKKNKPAADCHPLQKVNTNQGKRALQKKNPQSNKIGSQNQPKLNVQQSQLKKKKIAPDQPKTKSKKQQIDCVKLNPSKQTPQFLKNQKTPIAPLYKSQKKQKQKSCKTDPIFIAVVGGPKVGKSCLLQCYTSLDFLSSQNSQSIQYYDLKIKKKPSQNNQQLIAKAQVYVGQGDAIKNMQNVINLWKQGSQPHVCLICFSIKDKKSWEYANTMKRTLQDCKQLDTLPEIMLIGTHSDNQDKDNIIYTGSQDKKNQICLMTCSSRDQINVFEIFQEAGVRGFKNLMKRIKSQKNHFNYVLVGDQSVGKSCLIQSYADSDCRSKYQANQTVKFYEYKPNSKQEKYQGESKYTKNFYDMPSKFTSSDVIKYIQENLDGDVDAILICYSLVSCRSLKTSLKKWRTDLQNRFPQVPIILVGNKLDLYQMHVNRIQNRIKKLCEQNKLVLSFKQGDKKKHIYKLINQFINICQKNQIKLQIIQKQSLPNQREQKALRAELQKSCKPVLHIYEVVDIHVLKKLCRLQKLIMKNCSAFQGINLQKVFSHNISQGNQAQNPTTKPNQAL